MPTQKPVSIQPGDIVRLRKPHPCGSYEWEVTRVGTDIWLQCQMCQRRVMLPRSEFQKRLKQIVKRSEEEA